MCVSIVENKFIVRQVKQKNQKVESSSVIGLARQNGGTNNLLEKNIKIGKEEGKATEIF